MARDPNANPPSGILQGGQISKGFALVLAVALLLLIVLRHLFGSVTVSGGVR
jgi:uncharacterized protein (UPF0333 family)